MGRFIKRLGNGVTVLRLPRRFTPRNDILFRLPQSHPLLRNDMVVVHLIEDFVEWNKEYNRE